MRLAMFDLDNTLIGGDSDSLWTEFLVEEGVLGPEARNLTRKYYQDYLEGQLDMAEFLSFQLRPLRDHSPQQLQHWRQRFLDAKIRPILLPKAQQLIESHRDRGHRLLILTATNRFVTEPISRLLGVDHLLATEVEMVQGRYTGETLGTPCYRDGKVSRLDQWLAEQEAVPESTWFYSDSHNDIPLLERVTHPAAVDPDDQLAQHARLRGWPILSLREI